MTIADDNDDNDVCVGRLRTTNYIIAKYILHNLAIPASSSTSKVIRNPHQNLLSSLSSSNHLAIIYHRLTYVGFCTVRLVL